MCIQEDKNPENKDPENVYTRKQGPRALGNAREFSTPDGSGP